MYVCLGGITTYRLLVESTMLPLRREQGKVWMAVYAAASAVRHHDGLRWTTRDYRWNGPFFAAVCAVYCVPPCPVVPSVRKRDEGGVETFFCLACILRTKLSRLGPSWGRNRDVISMCLCLGLGSSILHPATTHPRPFHRSHLFTIAHHRSPSLTITHHPSPSLIRIRLTRSEIVSDALQQTYKHEPSMR
jgi:hypothetical protein